jgi:uncharacterized protein (TIGR01777 family)
MRILLVGASGLIGTALRERWRAQGHQLTLLTRPGHSAHPADKAINWDPLAGQFDGAAVEGQDVVVCLSGHNLMDGRWNPEVKQLIVDSRVKPVSLLAHAIAKAATPPQLFLSASAVGYYGHQPFEKPLDESAPPGKGFLADCCVQWEAAAQPAINAGVRTVLMRTGFVLSMREGALPMTVSVFKRGLGGVLGSGKQVISWIMLDDLLDALAFTVDHAELAGPVNYCAPGAVRNKEFTHALGHALHKPAFLPVPPFAVKAKLGEVADELLLNGQHCIPAKLTTAGFKFQYTDFETALKAALAEQ